MRFAFVVLLVACSSPAPKPVAPAPAPAGDPSCPAEVPGTSVTVEDTATGAALVFVTTGDAKDLQARAWAAVMAGKPAMWVEMVQTESTKTVENITGGARVAFAAKPEQVGALQSELRMHAKHLASGTCKMAM